MTVSVLVGRVREVQRMEDFLSEPEERRLVRTVQAGGFDGVAAKERLVGALTPLVRSLARRACGDRCPLTIDDLMQEGFIGLLVAIEKFDGTRGARLATAARYYIVHEIYRAIRDFTGPKDFLNGDQNEFIYCGRPADDFYEMDVDYSIDARRLKTTLDDFLEQLPTSEQQCVIALCHSGASRAEAARLLGVSRAAVTKMMVRVARRGRKALGLAA